MILVDFLLPRFHLTIRVTTWPAEGAHHSSQHYNNTCFLWYLSMWDLWDDTAHGVHMTIIQKYGSVSNVSLWVKNTFRYPSLFHNCVYIWTFQSLHHPNHILVVFQHVCFCSVSPLIHIEDLITKTYWRHLFLYVCFDSARKHGSICSWEIMSEVDLYGFLQMDSSFRSNSFITWSIGRHKNNILIVVEKVMPFQSWDNLL